MGKENEIRRGRLNETRFLNRDVVQKTGIIEETNRPSRLGVEAYALSLARKMGANVPQVLDYYRNNNGEEVLLLTRILGSPLTIEACLNDTNLLSQVGTQMSKLDTGTTDYGWLDPYSSEGSDSWKSFLSVYLERYGERLLREKIIEEKDFQKAQKGLEDVNLSLITSFLVHRDLKLDNLLKDEKSLIWIVDWENAILGDPLYDLALFEVRYGKQVLWVSLAKGYGIDIKTQKYLIYKIIALIGLTDFFRKHNLPHETERQQFLKLISSL